ncbi:hypothetical protein PG985_007609 [Apiospora marii]|uniref:uncharacterized protein n=1 Tax=Apiospora marii TaxID=335849 RepID=UPI003131D941
MENTLSPNATASFPTQDQEDWSVYYEYMDAAAASLGIEPAVFGETSGTAPGYSGYVAGLQDPPTSFENHPEPLSPSGTLQHSALTKPIPPSNIDTFSATHTYPLPEKATDYLDEAGINATQRYGMGYAHSAETVCSGQDGAQVATGYEMIQSGSSSSPVDFHCGMHGCQLVFPSNYFLQRHQRFHNKHHWVAHESPFICECGQKCAKLDTLHRHIKRLSGPPSLDFPCREPDCPRAFQRKDHLMQHLRHGHKFSNTELEAEFPPRQAIVNIRPVCHFERCPDYRDASFRDQTLAFQDQNKPFAKQADYTKHMRDVHEWSPYPCTVPACEKRDKKGYFSQKSLQKHLDEHHPEADPITLEPKAVQKLPCGQGGCRKMLSPGSLHGHRQYFCKYRNLRAIQCQL